MKLNYLKRIFVFLVLLLTSEVCFAEKTHLGAYFSKIDNKLIIESVYYKTPAYKYGLQYGDVVLKYNDITITDPNKFYDFLKGLKIGNTIKFDILRNNKPMTKTVKLEAIPYMQPYYLVPWNFPEVSKYVLNENVVLWEPMMEMYSKKIEYWDKRIPSFNDKYVLELDKLHIGDFDKYNIYTDGGHIIYTPKSRKVVTVSYHSEKFKGKKCADTGITEKIVEQFCNITKVLPTVQLINEELGNSYFFEFDTKPMQQIYVIRPFLNEDNNSGEILISKTSFAMQDLNKKELAQVEKYVDINKNERNVPTQLGSYRLGDKPILKQVYDREKGYFRSDGKFPFNNDCFNIIYSHHLLYFMKFGESGGILRYTPTSHRITSISLLYNKFNIEKADSKSPNYVKELLEKDVKEIESRLGIKAVREAEDRYVFNFPSKSKTKLIVDVFRTLNQQSVMYSLMTGEKEFAGNKINYVKGFISLTLTSEEMESVFKKEKEQILAEKKVKEEKAKEKKKQQDSAFGLN